MTWPFAQRKAVGLAWSADTLFWAWALAAGLALAAVAAVWAVGVRKP